MSFIVDALVVKQEQIAPKHFRLQLSAPEIAAVAKPGQFVHVSCCPALDPLLRRPLSIHMVERDQGLVTLFYRVAGRGTALLAKHETGSYINLIGPLGRGFTMPPTDRSAVLVAGGMGIAPLLFLAHELARNSRRADVFLGAATAGQLFFAEEISQNGHIIHTATDDGTAGYHGTVIALLREYLPTLSPLDLARQMLFACGPGVMLRLINEIISSARITGELSLEERMGCGVGACLSCICKTKNSDTEWQYSRVCIDGPVFPAAEVVWE